MNNKKAIAVAIIVGAVSIGGIMSVDNNGSPVAGAAPTPAGFLIKPPIDIISPTSPTSISCSIGGTGRVSSVDGTTRVAQITWTITGGTAGLISANNWYGYVPQNSNGTASESFSVPITGATTFTLTASNGRATSTCSTTIS